VFAIVDCKTLRQLRARIQPRLAGKPLVVLSTTMAASWRARRKPRRLASRMAQPVPVPASGQAAWADCPVVQLRVVCDMSRRVMAILAGSPPSRKSIQSRSFLAFSSQFEVNYVNRPKIRERSLNGRAAGLCRLAAQQNLAKWPTTGRKPSLSLAGVCRLHRLPATQRLALLQATPVVRFGASVAA